jgi:hypothetical protein
MDSATFTTDEKIAALQAALATGAITQAQYNTQYALLTNPKEPFDLGTFLEGIFSVFNLVLWAKTFASLFNIRTIIVLVIVGGLFFHFGLRDRVPTFVLGSNSLQGKSYTVLLPGTPDKLVLNPKGQLQVQVTKTNKVIGIIRIKDIPALSKAISPIGFHLRLIGILGAGYGTIEKAGIEGGAGLSWFHFHQWEADSFVTNKAVYPLGISYRFTKFASGNTSVGLAVSPFGFHNTDRRVLLYFRWAF